jgi:CelD/BcsL family acetyltransferase involved in cellulose biosynthesis
VADAHDIPPHPVRAGALKGRSARRWYAWIVAVDRTGDPAAFSSAEWNALAQEDPEGTLFHTPRFLKLYWEEFGAGPLDVAFVRDGDELVAAAAFEIRDGTLGWMGGFDVTDYMGPVGAPGARDRAAKELLGAVAARDDWERADLAGLPEEGTWLPALRSAAEDSGLAVEVGQDSVAPLLSLPGTFDEYLAALPGKLRHEIRRKERRLEEAFPEARLVDGTPETVSSDLDLFVELHRRSTGAKGRFMVPGMELFFRRLADEMLEDGKFRLTLLMSGDRCLAGIVGFRDRDRFLLYNSAYEHELTKVSPGMVLLSRLIRSALDEGCRELDLLKGDLPYKYRFGARPRRVARLLLTRR